VEQGTPRILRSRREAPGKGASGGGVRSASNRRLLVAAAISGALHLAIAVALVVLWADPERRDRHHGSYVLLSDAPPSKEPHRAQELSDDEQRPAKARPERTPRPKLASASQPLRPTIEAGDRPASELLEEPGAVGVVVEDGAPADGDSDGADRSKGVLLGVSPPPASTDPSPECLDGRDNDGDRLTDHEDPGCWPDMPEQELVSKRTGALLLSDMRSDDLLQGDPEELGRQRVEKGLRPDGESLVYRDGSFMARIGPDGEVEFDRARGDPFRFDFGGGGPGHGYLQRKRFLDATEDIRAHRQKRTHDRHMKVALARLGPELSQIWRDRSLSAHQKKRILFERLDECDLGSPGGRQAARIIIDFIRARFRSPG